LLPDDETTVEYKLKTVWPLVGHQLWIQENVSSKQISWDVQIIVPVVLGGIRADWFNIVKLALESWPHFSLHNQVKIAEHKTGNFIQDIYEYKRLATLRFIESRYMYDQHLLK
jgi:hypothetical protein